MRDSQSFDQVTVCLIHQEPTSDKTTKSKENKTEEVIWPWHDRSRFALSDV